MRQRESASSSINNFIPLSVYVWNCAAVAADDWWPERDARTLLWINQFTTIVHMTITTTTMRFIRAEIAQYFCVSRKKTHKFFFGKYHVNIFAHEIRYPCGREDHCMSPFNQITHRRTCTAVPYTHSSCGHWAMCVCEHHWHTIMFVCFYSRQLGVVCFFLHEKSVKRVWLC